MKNKGQLNQKIEAVTLKTLAVGIDIAKEQQWARFVDCRGVECGKALFFSNDRDDFERILSKIRQIIKENTFEDAIGWNGTNGSLLEIAGELSEETGAYPCGAGQSISHKESQRAG